MEKYGKSVMRNMTRIFTSGVNLYEIFTAGLRKWRNMAKNVRNMSEIFTSGVKYSNIHLWGQLHYPPFNLGVQLTSYRLKLRRVLSNLNHKI